MSSCRADSTQADDRIHANVHNEKRGLSDIIAALEGQGHKGQDENAGTKTVTVQAAAKGNGTCAAQKTVTVTEQAAAAAGTG